MTETMSASGLRQFLSRLGWSPERLAREINHRHGTDLVSAKAPYHWLRGAYPRGETPRIVASILSERLNETVHVEQIWPGSGAAVPDVVDAGARMAAVLDWLAEPVAVGSGGAESLAADVLAVIESRVDQVATLYERCGATAVLDIVTGDLDSAWRLADAGTRGHRLHHAIAELSVVAGAAAGEAGRAQDGQRFLLAGLRAARAGGDRELGARIIAELCLSLRGSGREALRLINVALTGVPGSTGPVRRLLRCRQASAYAWIGDVSAFTSLSDQVAAEARADPRADAGLCLGELGESWLLLDRPARAADLLDAALAALAEAHPHRRLRLSLALATAQSHAGDGVAARGALTYGLELADRLDVAIDRLLPAELSRLAGRAAVVGVQGAG
ncbi:hypothetical protein GCM10029964_083700 [Kibdelosporangium lantanae]